MLSADATSLVNSLQATTQASLSSVAIKEGVYSLYRHLLLEGHTELARLVRVVDRATKTAAHLDSDEYWMDQPLTAEEQVAVNSADITTQEW